MNSTTSSTWATQHPMIIFLPAYYAPQQSQQQQQLPVVSVAQAAIPLQTSQTTRSISVPSIQQQEFQQVVLCPLTKPAATAATATLLPLHQLYGAATQPQSAPAFHQSVSLVVPAIANPDVTPSQLPVQHLQLDHQQEEEEQIAVQQQSFKSLPQVRQRLYQRRGSEGSVPSHHSSPRSSSCTNSGLSDSHALSNKRQRSAFIEELTFSHLLKPENSGSAFIRVWFDSRGRTFYDCSCGIRKAVQDLKKIQRHLERHSITVFTCTVCRKPFERALQLNAHMRVHRSLANNNRVHDNSSSSGNSLSF